MLVFPACDNQCYSVFISLVWWMIAVSSSLTRGTSTTLRRSSEVRDSESPPLLPLRPDIITLTADCLYCGSVRETLLNLLCCVSLVTATISLSTGLQTGLLMVCVCACTSIHACVYSCVFACIHCLQRYRGRSRESALMLICWKTSCLKGCFKKKRLKMSSWGNPLFLAPLQEV